MAYNNQRPRGVMASDQENDSFLTPKDDVPMQHLADEVDGVDLRIKRKRPKSIRESLLYVSEKVSVVWAFMTIKVVFWDLGIALGSTISDFYQSYSLLVSHDTKVYGILSLAINWIPGIAAAIHFLSVYRHKYPWHRVLLYSLLLIICYPIVPVLAYIHLLWKTPKDLRITKDFMRAEYLATVAHAISGGLESPIQLIYQLWMLLNGLISSGSVGTLFTLEDWHGNQIGIPMLFSLSIVFSCTSIIKTSIELNLIQVHVSGINSWSKAWEAFGILSDFLLFLISGTVFRIGSILLCICYLNVFGFIPIVLAGLLNIIVNQRVLANHRQRFPLWLISFFALFFPCCFPLESALHQSQPEEVRDLQRKCLKGQTMLSLVIYCVSLTMVGLVVILPYRSFSFTYNPDILLGVAKFGLLLAELGAMAGICILLLLTSISTHDLFDRCCCTFHGNKIMAWWTIVFLVSGAVIPWFFLPDSTATGLVYYMPASNHTQIVQSLSLGELDMKDDPWIIRGILTVLNPDGTYPRKTSQQFVPPSTPGNLTGSVLALSRTHWEEQNQVIMGSKPSGLIIFDHEPYRPSSPQPYLGSGLAVSEVELLKTTPLMLVREEDAPMIQSLNANVMIWLSNKDLGVLRNPDHKCSEPGCLAPVFENGHIVGEQYGTMECFWGASPCPDFSNEEEMEPFCDGFNVKVCPVNGQEYGTFMGFTINSEQRILRSSPASCALSSKLEEHVGYCDESGSKGWIYWLRREVLLIQGDVMLAMKRRYCWLPHQNCIIEEAKNYMCCQNSLCSDPALEPCGQQKALPSFLNASNSS